MKLYLYFVILFNLYLCTSSQDPQPCPGNPITLTGSDFPQFIYSPYDERKNYPPNTDCKFLLLARNAQRRIHVNIIESVLEEPLFTDCEDYVSIRDGSQTTSEEIVHWCGAEHPTAITSSGDSLFVHFHSDSVIQKRGFNMSFIDFDLPGCPPDWESDLENEYCYKLFLPPYGTTWMDAQQACNYERSNLLTIVNNNEYNNVAKMFSQRHTYPWIGYHDAETEGRFESVDKNPLWPENFPTFNEDHIAKDCIYMNWDINDGMTYSIDDCRSRHSFICKKRQDGSTVPVTPPANLVRNGLKEAGINNTIWLLILALIVLLLIILLIVYMQFKKRYSNRVGNVDMNQKLVEGTQVNSSTASRTENQEIQKNKAHNNFQSAGGTASKADRKAKKTSPEKKENSKVEISRGTDSDISDGFENTSSQPMYSVFSRVQPNNENLEEKKEYQNYYKPDHTVIQMSPDIDGGSEDYTRNQSVAESDNPEMEPRSPRNDKNFSTDGDSTRPESETGVIAVDETSENKEIEHNEQLAENQVITDEEQAAPITTGLESLTRPTFPHSIALGKVKESPIAEEIKKMNEEVQTEMSEKDPMNMSILSEDFEGMQMSPMNPHTQKKQRKSHMHILNNIHAKTEEEFWS